MSDEISSSKSGWGGARANSGGARPNAGGARANSGGLRTGAGRPRTKAILSVLPLDIDQWFCVRAAFGQARTADQEMRLAGFMVFNPSIYIPPVPPKRDSRGLMRPARPERTVQAFPRYIFVRLNLSEPVWRTVRRLPGVAELISVADRRGGPGIPIAIPESAIARIRGIKGYCADNDCIYPPGFTMAGPVAEQIEAGTRIRVIDGPFEDDETYICDWSDGLRLRFFKEILGREVPFTVRQSSVQIAA